jgi:hypothetical protein
MIPHGAMAPKAFILATPDVQSSTLFVFISSTGRDFACFCNVDYSYNKWEMKANEGCKTAKVSCPLFIKVQLNISLPFIRWSIKISKESCTCNNIISRPPNTHTNIRYTVSHTGLLYRIIHKTNTQCYTHVHCTILYAGLLHIIWRPIT